jgi:sugar phosphate isomerase/epimerase
LNKAESEATCGLCNRRAFFAAAGSSLVATSLRAEEPQREPTRFQLACMTLPYSQFPLARALEGIKRAGFAFVAWGTTHREDGKNVPVLAADAPPREAKELAARCRDLGLAPVLMFSTIYPEAPRGLEVLTQRLKQAAAGEVPQVLTFGHTKGDARQVWIERFRQLGPIARDLGVTLVVKQHGGETGTGAACAEIVREVDDPGIMVNYDAGNVMDYLDVDPVPDIRKCQDVVRSFCLKDHRNWPQDQDCAPGYGEIDHYRLLASVAFTGRAMPLAFENIFLPALPRPTTADGIDRLAQRAREYMVDVLAGIQAAPAVKP